MKPLRLALRVGLGALLVCAGAVKLADPGTFADEIANYHLFPSLAPLLAATLPAIEVSCGLALVALRGSWRAAAALLALALLIVFTIAVTAARVRGIDVRCGCFGTGGGPITTLTILRDLAFVAWSAAVLRLER